MNAVGSILVNFGTNIVKLGHNESQKESSQINMKDMEKDTPEESGSPSSRRTWLIGFTIFMLGNILNFISFGFAAQSLLAALGSIQFLSNVVFAKIVLHESVSYRVICATFVIVCGNVLLVMFGNQESKTYTLDDLESLYAEPVYLLYISALAVLCLTSFVAFRYLEGKQKVGTSVDGRLMPITYALFSGSLGTQSIVFSKSISLLLRRSLNGDNMLIFWQTYVFLFAFVFFAVFWVTRLNKSLEMFNAVIIVPLMQVVWTVFAIFGGGIYFQEFNDFSSFQAGMFGTGVLTVTLGVVLLCPRGDQVLEEPKPTLEITIPEDEPGSPGQASPWDQSRTDSGEVGRGRSLSLMRSPSQMFHEIRQRSSTITETIDVKETYKILVGQQEGRMRAFSAFSMPMASIPMVPNKPIKPAAQAKSPVGYGRKRASSHILRRTTETEPVRQNSSPVQLQTTTTTTNSMSTQSNFLNPLMERIEESASFN